MKRDEALKALCGLEHRYDEDVATRLKNADMFLQQLDVLGVVRFEPEMPPQPPLDPADRRTPYRVLKEVLAQHAKLSAAYAVAAIVRPPNMLANDLLTTLSEAGLEVVERKPTPTETPPPAPKRQPRLLDVLAGVRPLLTFELGYAGARRVIDHLALAGFRIVSAEPQTVAAPLLDAVPLLELLAGLEIAVPRDLDERAVAKLPMGLMNAQAVLFALDQAGLVRRKDSVPRMVECPLCVDGWKPAT